jgi:hypothetical protein
MSNTSQSSANFNPAVHCSKDRAVTDSGKPTSIKSFGFRRLRPSPQTLHELWNDFLTFASLGVCAWFLVEMIIRQLR